MNDQKKRILLAGYNGFIGRHLKKMLEIKGFSNIILMSRSNGFDLMSENSFDGIDCDIVVNLCGLVGIGESWQNPEKFYKVNYLTTLNLLKIARKNCAAFVQISSYVYGEPEYQPIDELHSIKAYNPYASSKIFSEKLCVDYSKNFQIPVTILRPFNIYGLEQSSNFLIAKLIKSAKNKSIIEIFDMDAKRDYLWIDDLASGILKVINNNHEGLKIYNIGSGKSYSAREIVNIISDYIPNFNNYVISSNQKILIQDCICDNSLFSHDYGWKPSTTLENGIEKIIKNID